MSAPLTALALFAISLLDRTGLHPEVAALMLPYLRVVTLSLPLLLLYAAFRRYLQGMGAVRPVMFALLTANLVNGVVNWALIYGHFGAPAMGTAGAAWATVASRLYMMALSGAGRLAARPELRAWPALAPAEARVVADRRGCFDSACRQPRS